MPCCGAEPAGAPAILTQRAASNYAVRSSGLGDKTCAEGGEARWGAEVKGPYMWPGTNPRRSCAP